MQSSCCYQTFTDKYNFISENGFSFRETSSTEAATASVIGNIYGSLDKREAVLCVFVDAAKTFDTVNHEELLETAENIFKNFTFKLLSRFRGFESNVWKYMMLRMNSEILLTGYHKARQFNILNITLFFFVLS